MMMTIDDTQQESRDQQKIRELQNQWDGLIGASCLAFEVMNSPSVGTQDITLAGETWPMIR